MEIDRSKKRKWKVKEKEAYSLLEKFRR